MASSLQSPLCKCNVACRINVVAKVGENLGRRFYSCSNWNRNGCKFFKWVKDEPCANPSDETSMPSTSKLKLEPNSLFAQSQSCSMDICSSIEKKEQMSNYVIYTDGACKGNVHVKSRSCPSGWGVVILQNEITTTSSRLSLFRELYGPVILLPDSESLGAEVLSNNTAELCAIGEALRWILSEFTLSSSLKLSPNIIIRYDSEYAAKSITGAYNGEKNRLLIDNIRKLYAQVKKLIGSKNLEFHHVKGHSGDRWNDRADTLANMGAAGQRSMMQDSVSFEAMTHSEAINTPVVTIDDSAVPETSHLKPHALDDDDSQKDSPTKKKRIRK